ncbi:hypothetical protein HPP92_013732 [Vanilla planifolia]|uniref:Uncharacterized protein n=1 Tax=Vanilla planifolia TaxID=51239 RepID=A0A835PJE3_VANPL|nr:hypothetical protein HPP92_026453 [Vanilla planifolia]KAG0479013.1 hypothetical protein HPP92_013732 [Vanilla planifolia]
MASVHVLPNPASSSRKQGHLEAGKKKLEEFRKRKAEGRAKKTVSSGPMHLDNADSNEKLSHNHEHETDGSTSSNPGFSGSNTSHKKEGYSDKNVVTDNENFASAPNLVDNNHFSSDVHPHSEKPWLPNLLEKPGRTLLSNGYHDH